ncbi:MAG TPA: sigma-54 dependent transcriptional regulator [Opitutaceae bacterium]|jgi:DNA-binding NtrC family response regulator|nr:sigma-54 dependent transcriptional regulator [Opitutaceae bacterium]
MKVPTALPPGCEILVVEDDPALRRRLAAHLRVLGAHPIEAGTLAEARRLAADRRFDFALTDLHLPDGEALELLRERVFSENTGVVVMTAFGAIAQAVEAMRLGAGDYLTKPFEPEQVAVAFMRWRAQQAAERRESHRSNQPAAPEFFFGNSLAPLRANLERVLEVERRLAHNPPPVLIEGETGTGKSLLARWLHRAGPRADRPFIAINCGALPDNLAESDLFGHERGAFTDAKQGRIGLFEAADGGTLFLDEIGSLSPPAQAKLLSAVEDGVIRRLGGTRELRVDVRLIAATNRPLAELVATGGFREDLFHRLHLLQVTLPPLRERRGDIPALAAHILAGIARRHRLKNMTITAEGSARLQAQPWRGNARELAHELERAIIFGGPSLDFAHLAGARPAAGADAPSWRNPAWAMPAEGFSIDLVITELVTEALRLTGDNVTAAARRLGVTREFLRYRLGHGGVRRDGPPPVTA